MIVRIGVARERVQEAVVEGEHGEFICASPTDVRLGLAAVCAERPRLNLKRHTSNAFTRFT